MSGAPNNQQLFTRKGAAMLLGVGVLLGALLHALLAPDVPESSTSGSDCPPASTALPTTTGRPDQRRAQVGRPVQPSERDDVRLEELRDRVTALEIENDELQQTKLAGDPRRYGFSDEELELLARKCEVRADSAPMMITDELLDALGAKPEEREVIERVAAQFEQQEAERKRALLVEVGADVEAYDALDGIAREVYFHEQLPPVDPDEQGEVQRSIAEERAGLRPPPTDAELAQRSAFERYLRDHLSPGDRFATALARELGDERAEQLRVANGGWTGGGVTYSGCPGQ